MFFLLLVLLAGALLPVQSGLSAQVAWQLGHPVLSVVLLVAISLLVLLGYVGLGRLALPSPTALRGLSGWAVVPGLIGAFYVTTVVLLVLRPGGVRRCVGLRNISGYLERFFKKLLSPPGPKTYFQALPMNVPVLVAALTGLCFLAQSGPAQQAPVPLTSFVNPFIGTGKADKNSLIGSTFPGATVPFGFVQLSPDTRDIPVWSPASGYNYNDKTIVGFSHTHLSGTGISDLFDVLLMPATGDIDMKSLQENAQNSGYRSAFAHDHETARPGYYRVRLTDFNINAELTATEHAGLHRYTFPPCQQARLLIDLNHSNNQKREIPFVGSGVKILAQLKVIDSHTVEGYRTITGWTEGYRRVYFRAEFSKPFAGHTMLDGTRKTEGLGQLNGHALKVVLNFTTAADEEILVKVGLSATSLENARRNLAAEVPGWDFNQVAAAAAALWEKELEKIRVEGTPEQKTIFYTGLYHAFTQPNNIADVNGDYPGTDMVNRTAPDKKHFSTFSLWDTYRAAHPLYTLTQPARTGQFVASMLRQYDTFGFLPVWQLWGLENYTMIGNHAIPVVVDAALKGITGFDMEHAYEAVKGSATTDHKYAPLFSAWEKHGYIPEDVQSQSVSITLEVAYDDWCVAQLAKKLGHTADYDRFMKRAAFYKNLYDTKTRFFRAKNQAGEWLTPFDPLAYGGNGGSPYTEGNAWHYLFYVPQDVPGLVQLMGGEKAFCARLDTFFTLKKAATEMNHNASGFIGQYAHGNEPSHHAAYLYNYAGQPWKTQRYVAQVQREFYNAGTAGYAGNEDCGQMSSWYVFSAMGFYPVNPANGVYAIGSPTLRSARIALPNGKFFQVLVQNPQPNRVYIQSATLNGKPYRKSYLTHQDIVAGGTLAFVMGEQPNPKWGVGAGNAPPGFGY